MKQIVAFILLLALLSSSMQAIVIYTSFKLNQDYIASVLCINRNNKEVPNCKGSCHLKKELSKSSSNENDSSEIFTKLSDNIQFIETIGELEQIDEARIIVQNQLTDWKVPISDYYSSILHPPTIG